MIVDRFRYLKHFFVLVATIGLSVLSFIGAQTIWNEYVAKDYDKHLTEQVYVDVNLHQNVNLVFYRKGCPYCESGKRAVINAADRSPYPTFYIDVESDSGQELVKRYQVEKAATLVTVRDGQSQLYQYATKNKTGQIEADQVVIKEALDD